MVRTFFFVNIFTLVFSLSAAAKLIQLGELGVLSQKKLAEKGIENVEVTSVQNGSTLIKFLDKNGNILKTLELPPTARSQLDEFRPSKIQEYLFYLRTKSPHIVKAKLKAFPMEAIAFFFAIGVVTSSEIVFNYAKNPVAMDQFIEMQMDPIGQIAFAAFIVANGLAAEPLLMVIQNKTFRYFIPYLGMTVGLMASNIVHEIGHFPHLKECALKRLNCDKAYEAWLDYRFKDKQHEWMPSLVSMLVSTAVSGMIEIGVRTAGAQLAKLVGIEIMLSFTPSGWVARGGRWVYKIAQLAGFVYIDHVIIEPINAAWQNAIGIGPELLSQSKDLVTEIERRSHLETLSGKLCSIDRLKRSNDVCNEDFANKLFEFNNYLQKWQDFNFMPVMIAHHNWLQYLSQLAMEYHQTKSFYFDFISDTWKARFRNSFESEHLINKKGLFYGVNIGPNLAPELEDQMFRPNWVEYHQRKYLLQMLPVFFNKAEVMAAEKALDQYEKPLFQDIKANLLSGNDERIANAISQIRWYLKKDITTTYQPHQSSRLYHLLSDLLNQIGSKAEPLRAPGELYFRLYSEFKEFNNLKKGPHYMFRQMIFGPQPDSQVNLIRFNFSGFPAEFIAPKISKDTGYRSYLPEKFRFEPIPNHRKLNYFNLRISDQELGNSFEYLINGGIASEILGSHGGSEVHVWWEKVIDKQIQNALHIYRDKYKEILDLLVKNTVDKSESKLNRSSFSNNLFKVNQEAIDIYLALSYPSNPKITPSLMTIHEWSKLSLDAAPKRLKTLRHKLYDIMAEAAVSIKSPSSEKSQEIMSNLLGWLDAYYEFLDMETAISDRSKSVLKAAVNSQIERVKLWLQVTQVLDFDTFVNGEPEINSTRKCTPMSNGLGAFLRGRCN